MGYISASGTGCAARTRGWARSSRVAPALLLGPLLLGASPAARLDVDIEALRSPKGQLLVCLTRDATHYPDCTGDDQARHATVPAGAPVARFADLPSGDYAIALIHDENGNGRLDTFAGVPREGVGFSRNPRLMFGPPRFAAARFAVGNAPVAEGVRVRYFL